MFVNRRTVRIEWGDCDPAGIVFYPRYLAIFDECTARLIERATGMTKLKLLETGEVAGFPLVDVRLRFLLPTRFGDDVEIESAVKEIGKSSFRVLHRLSKGGELAVEAEEKRVWVGRDPKDPGKIKSKPIPKDVLERLKLKRDSPA
jgi:4-hydroxybenzoyl-CoA thioesterase